MFLSARFLRVFLMLIWDYQGVGGSKQHLLP